MVVNIILNITIIIEFDLILVLIMLINKQIYNI